MTTWPIVVTLSGPARTKNRRQVHIGKDGQPHMHYSAGNQRYERQLRYAMQQTMAGRPASAQPMRVVIEYRMPIGISWPRSKQRAAEQGLIRPASYPDYDRIANMVGDAGNGVIWLDDKQIASAQVEKIYSLSPGLTVTVSVIDPPAAPVLTSSIRQSPRLPLLDATEAVA